MMNETLPSELSSRRDRTVFAFVAPIFFAGIGWLLPSHGASFISIGVFMGIATLFAVLADRDGGRGTHLLGAIPAVVLVLLGLGAGRLSPGVGLAAGAILGTSLGITVGGLPRLGGRIYRAWLAASRPIGWTVSFLLLAFVFYAILTPTGLLMRLTGRDPMERRIDRDAPTYWKRRTPVHDSRRYFRQS
jgi:hypothetical protein